MKKLNVSAEQLLDEAVQATGGLTDFGSEELLEPLKVLMSDIREESGMTPEGWLKYKEARFGIFLASRLRTEAALKKTPAVLQQKLPRPVFIVSLPRCGSTLTHNLMGLNPKARAFLRWELLHPYPLKEKHEPDPRLVSTEKSIAGFHQAYDKIHPVGVHDPDECTFAFNQSFHSWGFTFHNHLPNYREWLKSHDVTGSYRMYKTRMQMILSQRAAPAGGHLVLKDPVIHPFNLKNIVRVFPDAAIVMIHRRIKDTVGSSASMIHRVRSLFVAPEALKYAGPDAVDFADEALRRSMADRAHIPSASILDVAYEDVVADPVAAMRLIHSYFRLPFDQAFEHKIVESKKQKPKGKGEHTYTLEQFGLKTEEVERRLEFYTQVHRRAA